MPVMKLHIVSFDVPWPANYGGVIDVLNRIQALHASDVSIILHCFDYGRGEVELLKKWCDEVHYYPRKNKVASMVGKDPMIVASRTCKHLLKNLKAHGAPILFEGQHTTAYLGHPELKDQIQLVRVHNVEHDYYAQLGRQEKSSWKKKYFKTEAKRLKKHEKNLQKADQLLCITPKDTEYYQSQYGNATHLPVAIRCQFPELKAERIVNYPFALYHGNLCVAENDRAAHWLLNNICSKTDVRFIFAGKLPTAGLKRKIEGFENVELIANPDDETLHQYMTQTNVHLLYTQQSTGIKLKLMHALCSGKPVLCNEKMVVGTGLEPFCDVKETPEEAIREVHEYLQQQLPPNEAIQDELKRDFGFHAHAHQIMNALQKLHQ